MSAFNLGTGTRRWIAAGALALAGGALGAGCGGPPAVDYTEQSTFCQQAAQADCSAVAVTACFGAKDATLQNDTTECVKVRSNTEHCNPLNLPYHSEYAANCVAAHANVYGSNPLDPGAIAAMTLACTAVFNNGGTQGVTCTSDMDCAGTGDSTGYSCVIHQGKGTCQIPVAVEGGNACTKPAAQCVAGYSCDAGGHCVQDPGSGQPCGPGVTCGTGLRCNSATMACAPLIADGKACTQASDCVGQFCVGSPGASVCSSTFTLAVLSPTCSDFTQ
jgi:hypothetical protein